ncbi:MAG: tetratricopeptide repeat protein [Thermoplasmata archaeon]|nr:tetratricopeptide repeat protein [Thermoplasmata archaeon]
MATAGGTTRPPTAGASAIDEARRLFRQAEERESHHDKTRYSEALKAYLAHVEAHRRRLGDDAAEVAGRLDDAAMAFYRLSQPELARRAADVGLELAPGSAGLLHHKALILIALNDPPKEILALLDKAEKAKPNDKAIWAARGDVLRLLNRPREAAAAYLRAQELDPTTTRYVDRALKLLPRDPAALAAKLAIARAHGEEKSALETCDTLLTLTPGDRELSITRIELLTALGDLNGALTAVTQLAPATTADLRVPYLAGKLQLALGQVDASVGQLQTLFAGPALPDAAMTRDVAERLESAKVAPELSLRARQRLLELEPRNLQNLNGLRALAVQVGKPEVAIAACRSTLAASPENLEAMRALAELLVESGKLDDGFEAFRALIKAHPHDAAAMRHAVQSAESATRPELVLEFARALVAAAPEDRPAREQLEKALVGAGRPEEALTVVDGLLQLAPDTAAYWHEKRRLLLELDRPTEQLVVYDELFRLDPTRNDVAIERGNLQLARAFEAAEGSPEREAAARAALVAYERASLAPELSVPAQLGVARASRLVKDPERAIAAYQAVLAAPGVGGRDDLQKELGHALREVGRPADAEAAYTQAIEAGREDPDLLWGEVQVLSQLNQDARALRYLDLLLSRDSANPMFLRRKGQLLLKTGHRPEGLAALKGAVSSAGNDPHAYFEVGEALRAQGAYADAVTYYLQGLALDAKSRPGRLALAETLQLAGRYNEVIPQVDELLREEPNDLGAWRTRADAYRALDRPAEVQYSLKAILLLDPHNGPALYERFRLHHSANEAAEAFEALSQLLHTGGPESQDAALWLTHGDLASALGHTDEATRSYEHAATLDPTQAMEIAARRARARLVAGRPDLALEALDSALANAPMAERGLATLALRAEILTALERPEEAKAVYEEVRRREPSSPTALAGIARSLLDQGHHAEARELLRGSMSSVPADPKLFLLLAEAESGVGAVPEAIQAVQQGVALLPSSGELWSRLGELNIAKDQWSEAAGALAHAIALDGQRPELHVKAGFVAEKLGHPNEALALYDRATQVAPGDKYAWTSRGLVLITLGRADDARASFERALALDSDFDAAKEGKKVAMQKSREGLIDRHGREALLLEARLHRPVTKNDLFVTLHVPYEMLDPVLATLSRTPKVDVDRLSESDLKELESASYELITTALERRPEGIERRGFTLADVAALSPPTLSLAATQRLFGYLKAVLETELRPENLKLAPDVEELARRALLLPDSQRTLFQIVRTLKVGIYKARLIKAVETAGTAVHAPLPSLNLGAFSPEFSAEGAPAPGPQDGTRYFAPEAASPPPSTPAATPRDAVAPSPSAFVPPGARCVGCGGIASVRHSCGATLCQVCLAQFPNCPKCGLVVSAGSRQPIAPAPSAHAGGEARRSAPHPARPPVAKPKPVADRAPEPARHPAAHPAAAPTPAATKPKAEPASAKVHEPAPAAPPTEAAPVRPRPPPHDKADDEPRL